MMNEVKISRRFINAEDIPELEKGDKLNACLSWCMSEGWRLNVKKGSVAVSLPLTLEELENALHELKDLKSYLCDSD